MFTIHNRFPLQLHNILDEAYKNGREKDLICWFPCGTAFQILDRQNFVETYCCQHKNFKSFLKQLNLYKFQRISTGPKNNIKPGCTVAAYYHPNFIRDRKDLAVYITRNNNNIPPKITKSLLHHHHRRSMKGGELGPYDLDDGKNPNGEGVLSGNIPMIPTKSLLHHHNRRSSLKGGPYDLDDGKNPSIRHLAKKKEAEVVGLPSSFSLLDRSSTNNDHNKDADDDVEQSSNDVSRNNDDIILPRPRMLLNDDDNNGTATATAIIINEEIDILPPKICCVDANVSPLLINQSNLQQPKILLMKSFVRSVVMMIKVMDIR